MRGLKDFFSELKRRKVIRAALAYGVVAWVVIQVAETTFEPLHLPEWSLTLVIVVAAAGFPLVLIIAWAYDLTRQGFQRETGPDGEPSDEGRVEAEPGEEVERSIAVLPFTDMSPEQDQQYFCEGVAEEILNTLAQVRGLRVASRMAAFQFDRRGGDVAEIAGRLRVNTILEGSVRKSGDRLRITAQLIDARNGYHLWSERFDDRTEDIFRIQDQIAQRVANVLQVTLRGCSDEARTKEFEAYDYYLKGWNYFHGFGTNSLEFARKMFSRALEIDPDFARAWAGLADTAAFLHLYLGGSDQYRREADEASRRALALCSTVAETHASRGVAHMINREYAQAEACFERALELNPNLYEPYYFYARSCVHQGKYEKAAELFVKAHEVDPHEYQAALLLPQVHDELGEPDKAREWAEIGVAAALRRLDWQPDDVRAMYLAAVTLQRLGRDREAFDLAERALALQPGDGVVLYNIACLYSKAGEIDKALDCLDRVTLPGMANREWIEHDADLEPLRNHPRFREIIGRLS